MTDDERRAAEVEERVYATKAAGDEYLRISRDDFKWLLASRLAWKYTAKCYATTDDRRDALIISYPLNPIN